MAIFHSYVKLPEGTILDGYHHHEIPRKSHEILEPSALRALGNGYHVHAAADGRWHLRLRWPRRSLVILAEQVASEKPQGSNRGFVAFSMDQTCLEYSCFMLFRSNKLTRDEVGNHNLLDVGESVRCTATLTWTSMALKRSLGLDPCPSYPDGRRCGWWFKDVYRCFKFQSCLCMLTLHLLRPVTMFFFLDIFLNFTQVKAQPTSHPPQFDGDGYHESYYMSS